MHQQCSQAVENTTTGHEVSHTENEAVQDRFSTVKDISTMATQISVVGTIATELKEIALPSGIALCTFRLASGERRYNREKNTWEDGETNWFTVNVFRSLATHTVASFAKGDRIIVNGKLRVKSWERNDKSGVSVEIDADALGHELRWGTTRFTKAVPHSASAETETGASGEGETEAPAEWAHPAQDRGGEREQETALMSGAVPF